MHIQPGVVEGAKIALSYATAAGSAALAVGMARDTIRLDGGSRALVLRSIATTLLVLFFFQILPHYASGISEVHFIFGATLYLIFGGGPAAIGLALGLLVQGLLFQPQDLPQYFMNVTTLVVPLYIVTRLVRKLVPAHAPYVGLRLWQALALAAAYQGGIILLVAFWGLYGQGFGAENMHQIGVFMANYLVVIIVEPVVTMAMLALAKLFDPMTTGHPLFYNRLHHPVS
ncbi:energy-coupling factor ABC transporter permease [Sphingobium cloacae]|uniref:Cobalt transporter n=1 Tax=Sphingobium cloacae TaxID=120107 RepID=A0A1E1F5W5_9SPHN|nr:energy-coupling factor ABC transporter permease [Sphingobium cloacae]BAV65915.1 cobalt transporter [Sphingobium cloacae]